jgi:hypothetical protein
MSEFSIERFMEGDPITIPAHFFEFLLTCLANQKFIHDVNADGLAQGVDKVREQQREMQRIIDIAYSKGWELLTQSKPNEPEKEETPLGALVIADD